MAIVSLNTKRKRKRDDKVRHQQNHGRSNVPLRGRLFDTCPLSNPLPKSCLILSRGAASCSGYQPSWSPWIQCWPIRVSFLNTDFEINTWLFICSDIVLKWILPSVPQAVSCSTRPPGVSFHSSPPLFPSKLYPQYFKVPLDQSTLKCKRKN